MYRRLKWASAPATEVTTRLTASLNKAQQSVLAELGGAKLVQTQIQFDSVAAQAEYGLAAAVARVLSIRDTANNYTLVPIAEGAYRAQVPDPSNVTGVPTQYARLGISSVQIQRPPTLVDDLEVVSSAAGDVTQTATIDYISTLGVSRTATAVLTGTTPVAIATDVYVVVNFYLSAIAVGAVTLQEASAGAALSSIGIGHLRETFQRIALLPTPASATTYLVGIERNQFDLSAATDEFPVPARFLDCVVERALVYEYQDMGDDARFAMSMSEYRRLLGLLNDYLVNGPEQVYVPGRPRAVASNLPSNYPTSGYGWP
jgi:hypothetical protein